MYHSVHAEVIRPLVHFLLSFHRFSGWSSGQQVGQQVLLPTELASQPLFVCFEIGSYVVQAVRKADLELPL